MCENQSHFPQERWLPEVRHYLPEVAITLVGLKIDLRDPNGDGCFIFELSFSNIVTKEEGEALKTELNLNSFSEVSAKTREKLEDVFMDAINIVQSLRNTKDSKTTKKIKCSVL